MTHLLVPLEERARREWIKFQLRVRGSSFSALARELGVSRHAPRLALVKPYPRMERVIAEKLGLKPQELWPERYDENGRPNRTVGRPVSSHHDDSITQSAEIRQREPSGIANPEKEEE